MKIALPWRIVLRRWWNELNAGSVKNSFRIDRFTLAYISERETINPEVDDSLPLGELEALASALAAVFLTFLHSAIAS